MSDAPGQLRCLADALLRRPAAGAAVCLIAGIAAHTVLWHRPDAWLIVAAVLLASSMAMFRRARASAACLGVALACAGVAGGQIERFGFSRNHLAHFASDQPRLAWVELRIDQEPRVLHVGMQESRPTRARQVMRGEVLGVRTLDGWRECSGRILVQVNVPRKDLEINGRIIVLGMLTRPKKAMNPGQFGWDEHYRPQRVLAWMSAAHGENVTVLESPGRGWLDDLRFIAREALAKGFGADRALDHALLRALVLGDSDPELRDVQEEFVRTGTSHHLAISGMHVAMVGMMVFGICRILMAGPRAAAMVGLMVVLLYALAVLPSPPVVRSVLLCGALGLGILGRRSVDGVQLLAATVLGMLIYQPLDLFSVGFQLSFVTVLGLMVLTTPLHAWAASKLRDRDMEIARRVRPPGLCGEMVRRAANALLRLVVMGVVAWAVSTPLLLFHFSQVSLLGIPASLLVAVPVFAALLGGFVKIVFSLVVPGLANWWATLAAWPIVAMRKLVEWLAGLPGNDWIVPEPGMSMVVLVFAAMALPMLVKSGRRWTALCLRGAPVMGLAVLLAPGIPWRASGESAGAMSMTLLSVGAGQCAVARLPSGQTVVFDAGSSTVADLARTIVRPYFKREGIRSVGAVFVSHANFDHYSAAGELIELYGGRMHLNPYFGAQASGGLAGSGFLESIKAPAKVIARGDVIELEPGVELRALWPARGMSLNANESSLVLALSFGGRRILLTGDIQSEAMTELLKEPEALKADVLIAPHHGSMERQSGAFVETVNPQFVLSSNDATLTHKQREFGRLMEGRRVYRTHESGAITVKITTAGSITVESFVR